MLDQADIDDTMAGVEYSDALSGDEPEDELQNDLQNELQDELQSELQDKDKFHVPERSPATEPATIPSEDLPDWKKTLEKVVKTVVAIKFCQPHAFDGEPASTGEATGFVVDAERGCVGRAWELYWLTHLDCSNS